MADLNVAIRIAGQDAASRPLKDVKVSLDAVEASGKRAGRALDGFGSLLRRLGSFSPSRILGGLAEGLGRVGLASIGISALTGALTGLGRALVSPITRASDLSESINKIGVIFGDASKQVTDFAQTAARDIGQSRNQALAAAGDFGNLFATIGLGAQKNADMSVSLVRLASDLASFHNALPEEALEAIRSGLVGESEPLRRFGILLNETAVGAKALQMGLADNVNQLTEAQKVQARYALILQQSATAQGDFARTNTGMANSLRIIRAAWDDILAALGEQLLPVLTPLISAFAQWLPGALEKARPALERFGQAVQTGAMLAIEGLKILQDTFGTAIGNILTIVIEGAQLVYEALSYLNPFARHSPSLVESVTTGLAVVAQQYAALPGEITPHLTEIGGRMEWLRQQISGQGLGDAQRDAISTALETQERAIRRAEAALRPYERALEAAQRQVRELGDALQDARDDLQRFQQTPLRGERAFDDRLFGLSQQQARLELASLDLQGRPGTFRQQAQIQRQMQELQRQQRRTELQRQLTIDPQRRALESIGRAPETPFADALKGAQEAGRRVRELEPAYQAAQAQTERMATDLKAQQDALQVQKDLLSDIRGEWQAIGGAAKAAGGAGGGLAGLKAGAIPLPNIPKPSLAPPGQVDENITGFAREDPLAQFRTGLDDFKTKMADIRKNLDFATDGVKTFFAALKGDWTPGPGINKVHEIIGNIGLGIREVGLIVKAVVDGDLPQAIDRLGALIGRVGPQIAAGVVEWGRAFISWAQKVLPDLQRELGVQLGKLWAWIKEQAPRLAERFLAEWLPAALVWTGQLTAQIGVWWITTGQREVGEFAFKMGAAIVSGLIKGLYNLGAMLHNAIIEQLRGIRIAVPLPGGNELVLFDGSTMQAIALKTGGEPLDAGAGAAVAGAVGRGLTGGNLNQPDTAARTVQPTASGERRMVGFQHGGSFMVGGSGGTDSQVVAFRATPGEEVTVTPPGQQGSERPVSVTVNVHGDVVGEGALARLRREIEAGVLGALAEAENSISGATRAGVAGVPVRS